jgi:hypothetical protein
VTQQAGVEVGDTERPSPNCMGRGRTAGLWLEAMGEGLSQGRTRKSAWNHVSVEGPWRTCAELLLGSWTGPRRGRDQVWEGTNSVPDKTIKVQAECSIFKANSNFPG